MASLGGFVGVRVPSALKSKLKETANQLHMNPTEFVREAIREKLRRESPDIYYQLFESEK